MRGEGARGDQAALGAVIVAASVLTMAFSDAAVKLASASLTVWRIFAVRALFAIPILLAFSPRKPI